MCHLCHPGDEMTQSALFPTPSQRSTRERWLDQLPDWLIPTIENQNQRLSPYAHLASCPRCHQPILRALDNHWDHLSDAKVDLTLLTNADELQALLAGRTTHTIEKGVTGITITERDKTAIQKKPANQSPHPVAPQHRCNEHLGYPIPWEHLYPRPKEATNEPPF